MSETVSEHSAAAQDAPILVQPSMLDRFLPVGMVGAMAVGTTTPTGRKP